VRTLIEQSPATDAGVTVGDLLIAIDGTSVLATTLNDLRQRFRVPGKRFALTLKRGDTTIERVRDRAQGAPSRKRCRGVPVWRRLVDGRHVVQARFS